MQSQTGFNLTHLQETIIRPAPEPKPLIPEESLDQMLYGTLTGLGLFLVIVVFCWILMQKVESDKRKKKQAEQVRNHKFHWQPTFQAEARRKKQKNEKGDSRSDDNIV